MGSTTPLILQLQIEAPDQTHINRIVDQMQQAMPEALKLGVKTDFTKGFLDMSKQLDELDKQMKIMGNHRFISPKNRDEINQQLGMVQQLRQEAENVKNTLEAAATNVANLGPNATSDDIQAANKSLAEARSQAAAFEESKLTYDEREHKKFVARNKHTIRRQKKREERLDKFVDHGAREGISATIGSLSKKGLKGGGLVEGITGIGGALTGKLQGALASRFFKPEDLAKGGMMRSMGASMLSGMGGAGMAVTGPVAGVALLAKMVLEASDNMTKLNKTITDGLPLGADMTDNTQDYLSIVKGIREKAYDARGEMMSFGKTNEDMLKVMNAYAKSTTGSLIETTRVFGSTEGGANKFTRNAIAFGKSLGMESTAYAEMVGKLSYDTGENYNSMLDTMGRIHDMAVSSALPANKFMEIFKNAASNASLYNNRMSALGVTIKMLGRYMGSSDINDFMGSFKDGFRGAHFQTRVGNVLRTGVGDTQDLLGKDFESRFNLIAKDMGGTLGKEFTDALTSGDFDKALQIISDAASGGSGIFNKQAESDARQLVVAEKLRRSGSPEDVASALKLGGVQSTFSMLEKQVMNISKQDIRQTGISGIAEVVAEHMGLSTKEIELYNRTIMGERGVRDNLKASKGLTTGNLELDDILSKQGKLKEGLSNEDLRTALYSTEEFNKHQATAEELTKANLGITTSISDKFNTIVEYWLQWVYKILEGIAGGVNDLVGMFVFGRKDRTQDAQALRQEAKKLIDKKTGLPNSDPNVVAKAKLFNEVADSLSSGDSTNDIIKKYIGDKPEVYRKLFGYTGRTTKTLSEYEADPKSHKKTDEIIQNTGDFIGPSGQARSYRSGIVEVDQSIDDFLKGLEESSLTTGLHKLVASEEFVDALRGTGGPSPTGGTYLDLNRIEALTLKAIGMDRVADQEIPYTLREQPEFREQYAAALKQGLTGNLLPTDLKNMIHKERLTIAQKRAEENNDVGYQATGNFSMVPGQLSTSGYSATSAAASATQNADAQAGMNTVASASVTSAEANTSTATNTAKAATNTASLNRTLSTGLTFDVGFLNGDFKNMMIDALNRGMDAPLMRHAILLAAIMHNPGAGDFISTNAFSSYGAIGMSGFLENVFSTGAAPTDAAGFSNRVFMGGAIPMLPSAPASTFSGATTSTSSAGKSGGSIYYNTFYINEASDANKIGEIVVAKMQGVNK